MRYNPEKSAACKALGLMASFRPASRIAQIVGNIDLEEIIECLRPDQSEDAIVLCTMFDRLTKSHRKVIDIDYLIAAAHCRDPHKIAGMICENYSRFKAIETQMVAAQESPAVMRSVGVHAKKRGGFAHAKLLLQTSGIAPVPKNQNTYVFGNRIDNSKKLEVNVQEHHDIVKDVASIFNALPAYVPSGQDSGENKGDRGSQKD